MLNMYIILHIYCMHMYIINSVQLEPVKQIRFSISKLQCSPLNSNSPRLTKFIIIMRCSNYEIALNARRKYNGFSRDHNHLSELTAFLN